MRIPIFRSGHDGYGDARRHTSIAHSNSYHRSHGSIDLRQPGEIRAGVGINALSPAVSNVGWTEPPIAALEWEDASGNPLILIIGDNLSRILQYGAVSADETLSATATGACLHDDNAGVPYMYVGYGGSSGGTKMQRRDRAGTFTAMTSLVADKLLSLGGDLYGTRIPASGTQPSAVWKIAAGTSITTGISLPTGTVVGFAGSPINELKAVRRKVCGLKPEGVFTYDRPTDQWFNHAGWMERMPHPDNGKGAWNDENGNLIVPLGSGGALIFDGEVCAPYDPLGAFNTLPDDSTPTQRIAVGGSLRHWSLIATKIGGRKSRLGGVGAQGSQGPIAAISTDSGGTYGVRDADIIDYDPTSVLVLDSLATATDYLLLGYPQPFAGVYLEIAKPNVNDATLTAEVWNGTAWTSIAIADLTVDNDLTNPCSLTRSGWVMFTEDPIRIHNWQQTTINTGVTPRTRYFVRLKWSANLDAEVEISAIDWLPWRAGIDADFGDHWLDQSGGLPHFLAQRHDTDGRRIAHDLGGPREHVTDLDGIDELGCMIYGEGGFASGANSARAPIFFGKRRIWYLNLPDDDRAQLHPWQQFEELGMVELSALDLTATELRAAGQLRGVFLDGEDWQATGYVWGRFLNGYPWKRLGTFDALPVEIPVNSADAGRWLQLAVGYRMTTTQTRTAGGPRITEIDADVEPYAGRLRRLPRQTPPVT